MGVPVKMKFWMPQKSGVGSREKRALRCLLHKKRQVWYYKPEHRFASVLKISMQILRPI